MPPERRQALRQVSAGIYAPSPRWTRSPLLKPIAGCHFVIYPDFV